MFFSEQILLFLVVLVTAAILVKWWKKKDGSSYRHPPSLPCLPLVGSLPFLRNPNEMFKFFFKKSKELGPIFTLRIGKRLVLTLNSKDAIEKAYVRNPSGFAERPHFHLESLTNPEYKGVIFKRNPSEWKKEQQLSLSILKEIGFGVKSVMETRITREVEAITKYVRSKKGQPFDPVEVCTLAASNIITNVLFGHRRDYDKGLSELATHVQHWARHFNVAYDIVPFIRYIPSQRRQIENYVKAGTAVFECMETEIAECLKKTDLPSFALLYVQKIGVNYDRVQLKYLLRDLVGAGSDTSAASLQWCLVALANNPDVQKRLYAEMKAVVPGDRLPTLQDEAHLPYAQGTMLEMSRWRTLGPLSIPRETSRDTVVGGYFIPGGTMVIANLYAAHNDAKVWKDPEVFRPERFLDNENNIIGKENVVAFSMGRRSCLGETLARAELFLIVTSLVQRFLILPPEGQDKLDVGHKVPVALVFHPASFNIRLIERS